MGKSQQEVWSRVASGIEAGIVGGLAMLAIQLSQSLWNGRVWWEVPNLFGSTFYGPRVFRTGAGLATLAGLALHFVITGTLGGVFGLVFGGVKHRGQLVLLGLLAAVGWYNLANAAFWPAVNPWVLVGSPRPATMVSHVLLGACLGYMGRNYIRPRVIDASNPASALGSDPESYLSGVEPAVETAAVLELETRPALEIGPALETETADGVHFAAREEPPDSPERQTQ